MSMKLGDIIGRVNKKIYNQKGKLGGDTEVINIANQSIQQLQLAIDLVSARRTSPPNYLFNQIHEYPLPVDMSYDKFAAAIFDRETGSTNKSTVQQKPSRFLFNANNPYRYDIYGYGSGDDYSSIATRVNDVDSLAVGFESGEPFLEAVISKQTQNVTLHSCNAFDNNGTWVASGDASNVLTNKHRYKVSVGSIQFDALGVGNNVIMTVPDMDTVDISSIQGFGNITMWLSIPTSTPDTITLRWGNDAANYYEQTVSIDGRGLPFILGWNLLSFDTETSTEIGTVDDTAIDYLQLDLEYTTPVAQKGFRMDHITDRVGVEMTLEYFSKYLVQDADGTRKEFFEDTDDDCILAQEEINLLIEWMAVEALKETRQFGEADSREIKLQNALEEFRFKHPSEKMVQINSYFNL